MTEQEKQEVVSEVRKEIQEELAIYIGNKVLKSAARIVGIGILTLGYYLISHGYIKL
jgi:hypothetical protein